MRNANAQRGNTMSLAGTLQQAWQPHVRHAETGDREAVGYDGQRCALLTTKSRNTCTRATVFNSSG
jgi:hypothetical protein